ncbi:transcriptional regulator, TetR family [Rhizobiales bacterium GAS188]|nr:transcriptional regulator, TetR family [Rhizobiales bacterium GAS188]
MTKRAAATAPRPYHHGKLKEALVEAALGLAEEAGVEGVTVREAARRAGVSSAAPFRHFPDREALMTAVAAESLRRFRVEIDAALRDAPAGDPLARFRAIGIAYIRWSLRNPAHFHIISTRSLFDFERSEALRDDNAEIISMVESALAEAAELGLLGSADVRLLQIAGRALVYGFARMVIDGHLPRWKVDAAEVPAMAEALIDLFIGAIARRPP